MRRAILICAIFGAAVLPSAAQVSAFPRPAWFRQHFISPPTKMELQPPRHLSDFVAGGNLELSLRNYLELVLQNNPDIAIARLSVEGPKNSITRALSALRSDSLRQLFEPAQHPDFR